MAIASPRNTALGSRRPSVPLDWYDSTEHRRKLAETLNITSEQLQSLTEFVRDHVSVALYGSMYTSTTSGIYALGAGWTQYVDFDTKAVTEKGTTFNTTTDSFSVNANGIYMLYIGFTFDHDEFNGGRTFDVRIFNSTDSTQVLGPLTVGVGRNTPATNFSFQTMFDLQDANEDDSFIVQLGNGNSITGVFDEFEVGVFSIGEIKGTNGLLVDPAA